MKRIYLFLLSVCMVLGLNAQEIPTLVINEIDYDQPGSDTAEFVEIKNIGNAAVSLNGVEIVLVNGSNGTSYNTTKLADVELKAGEYYIICYGNNTSEYCNQTVSAGLQNGAPDAIQLTFDGDTLDAVSYEGTIDGATEGTGIVTGDNNMESDLSLSRSPDGSDTNDNDADFVLACISPGSANNSSRSCLTTTDSAMVQIIHNSPAPTVDIYANGDLLVDDFSFRSATPFVTVPAGINIEIAVAGAASSSSEEAIATFDVTFMANQNYIVMATGIVGDDATPFKLSTFDMGRKVGTDPASVDLLLFHGSPDAPGVDVKVAGAVAVDNLVYDEFRGYFSFPARQYFFDIVPDADNTTLVGTYRADIGGLGGNAMTLFASGLLSSDPGFGLWVADVDGNTSELERVFLDTANVQIIHNSPFTTVDIYANGDIILPGFEYGDATPYLRLPAGLEYEIAVAPAPSTSASEAIATFNVTFDASRTYAVIANGVPGDESNPFNLEVNADLRTNATVEDEIDIIAFHGSASSPNVNIIVSGGDTLFNGLAYKDFSSYVSVPAGTYTLEVNPDGTTDVAASFVADLSGLGGQSVTVVARGDLNSDEDPFTLVAVLGDGSSVALPRTPSANVQVIHNAIAPTVDIYANGELLIDDFEFRNASKFMELPAEVDIQLAIAADTSTSAASAIATFDVNFDNGKEYIVIANGVLGNESTPFGLSVTDMGRSKASDASEVDLIAFHGSPGAPEVDVTARGVGTLFSNISFGNYTEYASVAPGQYYLDLGPAGSGSILATFGADLSTLGGQSVTVVASGFLIGDPSFALLAILADGTVIELMQSPVANVQVIHNAIAPTVDIYANGNLLIDDFEFRTAEPFQFLPAGVDITIGVAPDTSTSAASAIATFDVNFDNGKEYIVIANGVLGSESTPFDLSVTDMGRSKASDASEVDLIAFHGSPGAPEVDVTARGVGTLFSNISFGNYTEYASVAPGQYYLDLGPAGSGSILATFGADLSTLGGQSVTVVASGFLIGDPSFALLAILADGTVIELMQSPVANVQVIHNAIAPTVDIYANGNLLIDDFEFRTAEPFQFLPAGVDITIGVAPDTSTSAASAIATFDVNFDNGKEYIVIANGVLGSESTPFGLSVTDMGRSKASDASEVDLIAFHGSPGAPEVDVTARGVGTLFSNISFGNYTNYASVAPGQYYLDLGPAGSGSILATFGADLSTLGGQSVTVVASGFLIGDPSFALLAILADGTVIELMQSPVANVQVIHNAIAPTVDIYANGNLLIDDFEFRTAEPFQFLPAGVDITIGVAADTSTSAASAIATFDVNFDNGKEYIVIANGVLGSESTPFGLSVTDMGRSKASDASEVDLIAFHGSPGAPEVDVTARGVGTLFSNISFGNYTEYASVAPGQYYLDLGPAGSGSILATFEADLSTLGGQSVTVVASGFLIGDPSFALLAILADGTVIELMQASVANVQVIHNAIAPAVDIYANGELLIDDFEFRTATPFEFLPAGVEITLAVAPDTSTSAASAIATFPVTLDNGKTYVVFAKGILGDVDTPFGLAVNDMGQTQAASGTGVDLLLYHGSPDAPAVDVLTGGSIIYDDIAYDGFSSRYENVPAAQYILDITPSDDNNTIVASYTANVNALEGGAAVVFASGFFSGSAPGFAVWVALPDGMTFPLPITTSTNELERIIQGFSVAPNPAIGSTTINFGLEESADLNLRLMGLNGQLFQNLDLGRLTKGDYTQKVDLTELPTGQYVLSLVSDKGIISKKLIIIQ